MDWAGLRGGGGHIKWRKTKSTPPWIADQLTSFFIRFPLETGIFRGRGDQNLSYAAKIFGRQKPGGHEIGSGEIWSRPLPWRNEKQGWMVAAVSGSGESYGHKNAKLRGLRIGCSITGNRSQRQSRFIFEPVDGKTSKNQLPVLPTTNGTCR